MYRGDYDAGVVQLYIRPRKLSDAKLATGVSTPGVYFSGQREDGIEDQCFPQVFFQSSVSIVI